MLEAMLMSPQSAPCVVCVGIKSLPPVTRPFPTVFVITWSARHNSHRHHTHKHTVWLSPRRPHGPGVTT